MTIKELKSQFLEHLEIEMSRSAKTIENYDHYLERFLEWSHVTQPEEISDDLVRSYRVWLNRFQDESGRNLKKITQNYYIIALRSFLKYLAKKDIKTLTAEKVEVGKSVRKEVEFLEEDEVERILEAADGADFKSLRDRAILELLFSSGLRVSELTNLNRDRLDLKKQEFAVRGSGGVCAGRQGVGKIFLEKNGQKICRQRAAADTAERAKDGQTLCRQGRHHQRCPSAYPPAFICD